MQDMFSCIFVRSNQEFTSTVKANIYIYVYIFKLYI